MAIGNRILNQSEAARVDLSRFDAEKINRPTITFWQGAWRRLRKNPIAIISMILLGVLIFFMLFGPAIANKDYITINAKLKNQSPNAENWFGTDALGRDLFSRIWLGCRLSLLVALVCSFIQIVLGCAYGGTGYIDLGMDTVYDFDEYGNLLAPEEMTWIAINDQPVAYYHEFTVDDGEHYTITGRVPVLYNGERAELILEFTQDNPYGSVVGVRRIYKDGETETLAKTLETVKAGDVIDFICDYYSYDGVYLDSFMLGEQLTVTGELVISDVYVDSEAARLTYCFTDIYNRQYWTAPTP